MSSTDAVNPFQASSPSKAHSKSNSQQVPHLELCIYTSRVGLYPCPPANITDDTLARLAMTTGPPINTSSSDFTCLLCGSLKDFLCFSRREQSQWLIDIAHDICDPVLKRGLLKVRDAPGQTWRSVNPTDPLTASVYLYDVQTVIALSKISAHKGKSITNATGNPSTMANRVKQRDGERCWVTKSVGPLTNSHVCPKRMDDHTLRIIYSLFVSTPLPPALSIYDEICGITLVRNLDAYFDTYELGLRFVGPDEYECHSFLTPHWPDTQRLTVMGVMPGSISAGVPLLHGYTASPPRHHSHNPPPGLIRWHYLQCVIRKFAHSDYKNLQNIFYSELPLRMEGDSDEEEDGEYDWPSAILDGGRAMEVAIKQDEEHYRSVAEWAAAV